MSHWDPLNKIRQAMQLHPTNALVACDILSTGWLLIQVPQIRGIPKNNKQRHLMP